MDVYLTGFGSFLPGEPLDNEEIIGRLGADPRSVALGRRVLAANGIRSRHYALDSRGEVTTSNAELAAHAVERAVKDRGISLAEVGFLAAGTTQADSLVPGFASAVHGRLGSHPMEILSSAGVCASSMGAFLAAVRAVQAGDHDTAVVVGSELVSRSLRQSRYPKKAALDSEFLRWTLSDGAGAVVVQSRPRADGLSLRVDWTHLVSHADEMPVCMSAGVSTSPGDEGVSWLDLPTVADAEAAGLFHLRQDVAALPRLFAFGVADFSALVQSGRLRPEEVDHLLCHYSAERFRGDLARLMAEQGVSVPDEKWFSNLATRGNTGAASIWVMLEEAWRNGLFSPGDRILLAVPESGRHTLAFAHLTCVEPPAMSVLAGLAQVWAGFEEQLAQVPLVRRIETGSATLDDYRSLLLHLRQQVVEGGRWISLAASSFDVEHFELRSAAIKHAAAEHRDFRLLERDYVSAGGQLATIQGARKNLGSEALSAFMFHQASRVNPVDLLGAMFIIEGLGSRKALGWARMLQEQLGLADDQVTFLRYHGEADDEHVGELAAMLGELDASQVEAVIRTATIVARLYAWQLSEIDGA